MPKKSRKSLACKGNIDKRWDKPISTVVENESVGLNNSVDPNFSDITPKTGSNEEYSKKNMRLVHLESNNCEYKILDDCKYVIIDATELYNLLKGMVCNDCGKKSLEIAVSDGYGFAHKMEVRCNTCIDQVKSTRFTSKRVDQGENCNTKRPPFDVNKRMVHAFTQMGKGYAAMEQFSMSMNLKSLSNRGFHDHIKHLSVATESTVNSVLKETCSKVRQAYEDLIIDNTAPEIIDISVSYDGTWHTRGHTSLFGVGCVIDILTGYVIDFHVMSKYCQFCKIAERDLGVNSPEFFIWKEGHNSQCDINHVGSSGSMEMNAAVLLWQRSLQYGFRYTTVLCDGDAKSVIKLNKVKPYGDAIEIQKEECVNHVGKRLGTALRNAVSQWRSRGVSLGGKGHGTLKLTTIQNLTRYYQNAIISNKGDVNAMKTAIYASLLHCISTDEKPQHIKCPIGTDSWCFYQRAIATGNKPISHCKGVGTPLKEAYLAKVMPVYQRLASDALLERCSMGRTQNANESLHAMIWRMCPKETFSSKRRIQLAVNQAVCSYNVGVAKTVIDTQKAAGISPGHNTLELGVTRDQKRVSQNNQRAAAAYQRYRQTIKMAKLRETEANKKKEGPTYKAGLF